MDANRMSLEEYGTLYASVEAGGDPAAFMGHRIAVFEKRTHPVLQTEHPVTCFFVPDSFEDAPTPDEVREAIDNTDPLV